MPRPELESRKRFEPSEVEPRIVERWLGSGLFSPAPQGSAADNYSIAVPPPNVTGSLHMGHALNGAIQDVLARYHRMRGLRTKWIFGTDHAGIATQTKVEHALAEEGASKEELGREAFVSRVWDWRREHGSTIREQFQRLGASLDYRDERFTLDDAYAAAVLKVFVDLHGKGLVYRDRYLVNWDPGTRSAISDLEVVPRNVKDVLYHVRYDVEGGGEVVVATVRPETILADTAVAVHPEDERYRDLVGRTAVIPLVERRVTVIADEYVKPEFGTGALKITPGHDPNDFEIGRKHGLDEVSVIGEDGRMNEAAGEFAGPPALEARARVVEALEAQGRIVAREDYEHEVPVSHRSGERIEPLVSLQWFMDMERLAEPAIAAVRDGRVRIHPEGQRQVYLEWMERIRPWCVSRQLWWGHQLPVWYRGEETHVGTEPPPGEGWERDPDVLDTWFSSALWPFATLGWPQMTPALRAFYPTDVLSTARDILFLWVARMIMMGLEFLGEVPFHDVYVHSVIQAPDGRRMSKSLGTGIDPVDEIERHGADAVRFGLLAMSSTQDVKYSSAKVEQGQQLANKLWNASRFALLGVAEGVEPAPRPHTVEDRWILSRVQRAKRMLADCVADFDFSHAALGLYDFVYGELCDWYLEMVKPRLYDEGSPDREALSAHLLFVLTETLELAHPVIPFVTEEIWSYLPGERGLLAGRAVEGLEPTWIDDEAEAQVGRAIDAVRALRGWRDSVGLQPGQPVPARLAAEGYDQLRDQVARFARLALSDDGGDPVASVPIPGGSVEVFAGGPFDPDAADRRRTERRAEIEAEIARSEAKLSNQGFVSKAPEEVVAAEREKLERLRADLEAM